MNYSIIDSVVTFKCLGLVLDSNLKWNCHIDHISHTISRAINALKSTFPINILIYLYNKLILPHYCLLVWDNRFVIQSSNNEWTYKLKVFEFHYNLKHDSSPRRLFPIYRLLVDIMGWRIFFLYRLLNMNMPKIFSVWAYQNC